MTLIFRPYHASVLSYTILISLSVTSLMDSGLRIFPKWLMKPCHVMYMLRSISSKDRAYDSLCSRPYVSLSMMINDNYVKIMPRTTLYSGFMSLVYEVLVPIEFYFIEPILSVKVVIRISLD